MGRLAALALALLFAPLLTPPAAAATCEDGHASESFVLSYHLKAAHERCWYTVGGEQHTQRLVRVDAFERDASQESGWRWVAGVALVSTHVQRSSGSSVSHEVFVDAPPADVDARYYDSRSSSGSACSSVVRASRGTGSGELATPTLPVCLPRTALLP